MKLLLQSSLEDQAPHQAFLAGPSTYKGQSDSAEPFIFGPPGLSACGTSFARTSTCEAFLFCRTKHLENLCSPSAGPSTHGANFVGSSTCRDFVQISIGSSTCGAISLSLACLSISNFNMLPRWFRYMFF